MILPLATAINERYALPLAVTLTSLQQELAPGCRPILHLLHAGISPRTLDQLNAILETRAFRVTDSQLAEAPQCAHLPKEASFPLLLAEVLGKDWEQVLFLDADLLVLDDVTKIWETPLDDHLLAAAQDAAMPYCSSPRAVKDWQALGIPAGAAYFNGGVMLLHLGRWQEREGKRKVRHYLERTGRQVDFLHQEAMNSAFWGQWKAIDERWNLIASRAGRPYDRSGSQAWRHPGIVHFAGQMKPWRAPVGGPFQQTYQNYLEPLSSHFTREPATARELLKSFYDRKLRDWAQPVEQFLWERKLL